MDTSITFSSKVKTSHLTRNAYLYIRQSTLRQVYENSESTKRQYALKGKVRAMGWPDSNIIIIDTDLGQSGAESQDRVGFQRLVSEVGMGQAGIVVGIEVSRLSRSSADWIRLMEICAITDTLIMDEDGIYNVNDFNDRLLLGLKGTMSEAELHYLQARMRGGLLNKAKRGELQKPLPIGYMYNDYKQIIRDSDMQVQEAINIFFQTFNRVGSASGAVHEFNSKGLKFPLRIHKGFHKGELKWVQLVHSRALQILHNLMYAGIYIYGKTQIKHTVDGKKSVVMPKGEWHTYLRNSHPVYITEEDFEENQKILQQNAHPRNEEGRSSPPREGPALLQGIIVCGKCGEKMTLRYNRNKGKLIPIYQCQKHAIEFGGKLCQSIHGKNIDETISKLLVEIINPLAVDAVINVQNEMLDRKEEIEKFYNQQVERARYNMELARRRYMNVDPDNRLVANELEAEWNLKLKELELAHEECEKKCQMEIKKIDDKLRDEIKQVTFDFPRLWNDPNILNREKKRMVRCIIEDVTITGRSKYVTLGIRFKGGTTKVIDVLKPLMRWQTIQTPQNVLEEINNQMLFHTNAEIAEILNNKGYLSGTGQKFSQHVVASVVTSYKIESRQGRLRKLGLLTMKEKMEESGISQKQLKHLRENNQIKSYCYSRKRDYLYEPEKYTGVIPFN